MSSIKEQKKDLRKKVLEQRRNYPEDIWRSKSEIIISKVLNSDIYKKADVVHIYVSMNDRREVLTDPILKNIFESKKQAVVPVVNFPDNSLSHTKIHSLDELKANDWGVREPEISRPVDVSDLDLIIVPLAAADRRCNRLGYGKGFYDRFLSKTKAAKVGLTFQDFIFNEIPVNEYDISLDTIITEEEVILP